MSELRVALDGGIATVALNRPAQRNALHQGLVAELSAALDSLRDRPELRVLVLRGQGAVFCAGADLAEMERLGAAEPELNRAAAAALAGMLRSLFTFPRPTVARVQGAAIGGGLGLVAACDLAIAAEDATFGCSEVRLGLIPAVISPYLVRKTGAGALREWMLTGARFPAARARALGLIDHLVRSDELDRKLEELCGALLEGAPEAQAAIKELLERAERLPLEQAEAYAIEALSRRRSSTEAQLGLASFRARKPPPWAPGR
jgi:methylglutaconyl-CoA hydratase